jgi:electron transfer flavoprotein alpha subunit
MSTRDILVLAETQRDALADISLELVAAARQLASATGGKVLVLLPGRAGDSHVAALAGADRILRVDDPRLASYSPEPYLAVLEDVVAAERPRAVLIGATSIGWDLAPMLSARLGAPLVTGCKQIQADGEALRVTASFCGGKMLADVQIGGAPAILMVLPGSYRPTGQAGEGQVEPRAMPALAGPGAVCFEELIQPESGDVDITQQEILVAVGRGIQQKENLELA